jgi:hypothetical protein
MVNPVARDRLLALLVPTAALSCPNPPEGGGGAVGKFADT